ncbi:3-demethylubiquinone-9 3-methyltransferase [Nocardia otitidiscaviarum]|uniref:3-demethylubiquinone-9 3-methyltransferase n=1 Tax=Nocardia otitidiscaviarum TaxID=1823 RepID=A0A378YFP4_9NOCA|nr:class I SAM-dependent methyltransferase [Nocardia otitidiscaviarum]SUA75331.1 3-demethylubiquinone-9 3-methyltransferase [Nocardia otitidiscaviarum]
MLTVDFDRLRIGPGVRVIDVGCGAGRHSFEAYRRGADVVAFDQNVADLADVQVMFEAMAEAGESPDYAKAETVRGDALDLPYGDGEFDVVIASEILEHIPRDGQAVNELVRVLKPGGALAVTVPRWLPERICWALSDEYHANEGGHVRIYKADELREKICSRGVRHVRTEYAHALHAPYWWLKCAVGVSADKHPLVSAYHRMLVWDMMSAPPLTRVAERLLDPLIGKSVALYFTKPAVRLGGY